MEEATVVDIEEQVLIRPSRVGNFWMIAKLRVRGITFDHWHTLNYARLEKGPEGLNRLILRELVRNNLTIDKEDFLSSMRSVETRLQKGVKE